ncbi:uncharacterized protein LOC122315558 [Carya illinoinensis]|uniref:uncharacterized protein LOC122315558 n=1 Tax=Carya illinoinensis TaxID=32201 RepID=UPI001C719F8D|nr:uncharacterized protein LOC122315558 [Carya illinoinensis]
MATKGSVFSWCNGQTGLASSWARLDRALMDSSFLALFPNASCSYLPRSTSNHAPMFIEFMQDPFSYGMAPFHFQQMWVDYHDFLDCVRLAWEIEGIEQQLQLSWKDNLGKDLHEAVSDLATWRHWEEVRLAQMAKLKWKMEGDRNTKFFLACLTNKRRKRVLHMQSNGVVFETPESIHQGAIEYFTSFLHGEPPIEQPSLEDYIAPVISEEDNASLTHPPTIAEVFEVVSSIPPQSASGPDGFGPGFYKTCWVIVKVDVWKAVLEFFVSKNLPKYFTASYFVLIPKVESPTGLLPRLISLEQGAFVPGRSIFENISLTQEMVIPLKEEFMGRAWHMALSVDDRLQRIGIPLASKCDCCIEGHIDDMNHVLFEGDFPKKIWSFFCHYIWYSYWKRLETECEDLVQGLLHLHRWDLLWVFCPSLLPGVYGGEDA